MPRPVLVPRTPFTRLPADQTSSDLYDKTAVTANKADANGAAIAEQKRLTDTSFSEVRDTLRKINNSPALNSVVVLSVRRVTKSSYLTLADYAVIFLVASAAIATLPNCREAAGQILCVKCDAGSSAALTLNSVGNETIDGLAASSISLNAGQAITLQSDGQNWIILGQL